MILNLSGRTDLLAFYTPWLLHRLQAGFVRVRNPYRPQQVHQYQLTPEAVDCLVFCTKNPQPLLESSELVSRLQQFQTYFFVTITPYGADLEPHVPHWKQAAKSTAELAALFGTSRIAWRYDPILLSKQYSVAYHQQMIPLMTEHLVPSVHRCVISLLDLYHKTKRNSPDIYPPDAQQTKQIVKTIGETAVRWKLPVSTCAEEVDLHTDQISQEGCISAHFLQQATGLVWQTGSAKPLREHCHCLPSRDIGAYNSCPHGCRYCYANYDLQAVQQNIKRHNCHSPFLLGEAESYDEIHLVKPQASTEKQLRLDF